MATRVLPVAAAAAPRRHNIYTKGFSSIQLEREKENGSRVFLWHTASFMGGNEADESGMEERKEKEKEKKKKKSKE